MRTLKIMAALVLAPTLMLAPAMAQNAPVDTPSAAHTSAPSPTAAGTGAAQTDITSFQPTPFEANLFQDPRKITQQGGENVYQAVCAGCHMADAKGAVGAGKYPALAGNENLAVGDYPVSVIINGLHGMPPFRQVLDDQQIVDVVTYLQGTLKDAEVYPATIEAVKEARAAAEPLPE